MSGRVWIAAIAAVVAAGWLIASMVFTVDETQQALVLRFGKPVATIVKPGLYAQAPLIDTLVTYDNRIMQLAPGSEQVILTGGLVNAATAAFTGMETMHLYSFMLIIQSIAKTALILALVLLGFGTLGAITGFTTASVIAGLAGILLMWTMYKSLPKPTNSKLEIMATIKTMLKYGLPVSIGTIITGFLTVFYSYILAFYVTNNAIIGNYNLAINFVVLITFFATPVTTMLFPAFSKLDYKKDNETLKNVFQYSVKYASLIVVPVAAMVIALAQPGIGTIYQNRYAEAPLFLALLSVTYLYTAFGNLSVGNLINGQGLHKIQHEIDYSYSRNWFSREFPVNFSLRSHRINCYFLNSWSSKFIHKFTIYQKTLRSISRLGFFREDSFFFSNNRNLNLRFLSLNWLFLIR